MMRSFARDWFIDTLSLYALNCLSNEETLLRNRNWTKCINDDSKIQFHQELSKKRLGAKRVKEAEIFREVMIGSIQVTFIYFLLLKHIFILILLTFILII